MELEDTLNLKALIAECTDKQCDPLGLLTGEGGFPVPSEAAPKLKITPAQANMIAMEWVGRQRVASAAAVSLYVPIEVVRKASPMLVKSVLASGAELSSHPEAPRPSKLQ